MVGTRRSMGPRGAGGWGGVKRSHPTTLVLDPAQQPLSKEVQCPAHDGPDQLGHLGAQGLWEVGWASGTEPCPYSLGRLAPSLPSHTLSPSCPSAVSFPLSVRISLINCNVDLAPVNCPVHKPSMAPWYLG